MTNIHKRIGERISYEKIVLVTLVEILHDFKLFNTFTNNILLQILSQITTQETDNRHSFSKAKRNTLIPRKFILICYIPRFTRLVLSKTVIWWLSNAQKLENFTVHILKSLQLPSNSSCVLS